MADHCRKQIRDSIKAYLTANMSSALIVATGRVHPIETANLPAVLVYTNEETAEDITKSITASRDRKQSRDLTLSIECYAAGDDIVDALDNLAAGIESLILQAFPAWVKEIELTATTTELTGEAVEPYGMSRLEYIVTYHTNMSTPDIPE